MWLDYTGTWCRALLDWKPNEITNGTVIYDYKTTGKSSHPANWASRDVWTIGGDIQAAFYLRGLQQVFGVDDLRFRFVVQENNPPYNLSVVELSPASLALANKKIDKAISTWQSCLHSGRWPGYDNRVIYADPPKWQVEAWIEADENEIFDVENMNTGK
jgi:hypothetical protein